VSNGKGCKCNAHCEHECCCDADWTPKEVYDLRADLAQRTAEVAKANAERDEARREACVSEARYREERAYPLDIPREEWIQRDARSIAAERGWDCFEKEANQ
jgi:hypothetical protein